MAARRRQVRAPRFHQVDCRHVVGEVDVGQTRREIAGVPAVTRVNAFDIAEASSVRDTVEEEHQSAAIFNRGWIPSAGIADLRSMGITIETSGVLNLTSPPRPRIRPSPLLASGSSLVLS